MTRRAKLAKHPKSLSLILTCLGLLAIGSAAFAVTVVWTRTADGPISGQDGALGTALAPGGSLYVAGYVETGITSSRIWIRKYSSTGAKLWTRNVDGQISGYDFARGAVVDGSGNLYVVGQILNSSTRKGDIWVRKYNPSGATLWTRTVNGPGDSFDAAYAAAADSTGKLYVVGHIWTPTGGNDIWVRKYNGSGGKLWTRVVNGPGGQWDRATGVAVDGADNVYVVGYVYKSTGGNDIWIRKYSPGGSKLWTRTVNGPANGWDEANAVAVDSKDNVIVTGFVNVPGESEDIWIRKYDSAGKKLWTRTVSGSGNDTDKGFAVAVDTNDAVYISGETRLSNGKRVTWIAKYSSAGVKRWTAKYGGPNGQASGDGIAINDTKRVYVVGRVYKSSTNDDIWVRKYRP